MKCKTCNNVATNQLHTIGWSVILLLCDICRKDLEDFMGEKEINYA